MNHVLIRADGSKDIGMGHINRCYLFATYLENIYNLKIILLTKQDISTRRFLSNKKQLLETIYLSPEYSY